MKAKLAPAWNPTDWAVFDDQGEAVAWLNNCSLEDGLASKLARQFAASDKALDACRLFVDALDAALNDIPPDACVGLMNEAEAKAREALAELEDR